MLVPKLVTTLRHYTPTQFRADLQAGLLVGIVALPLAIAFGIASGVTPTEGLATAIIGGFLISALGGSRVQIGGPTGAFVVIVAGIVHQHGVGGLALATVMAGFILIGLGLARLGGVIKFIPYPVITGFTTGIALIIASTQVKDFLGLPLADPPPEFFAKWVAYLGAASGVHWPTLGVGAGSLAILLLWPRVTHRIPATFVALITATVAVALADLPVDTIADRFGALPAGLPAFRFPAISETLIVQLAGPALTIAMLGAIESLLSAVVADGMIGGRHRSNMELVGQGVANVVLPFFGGIPATGAIARTATNVKAGGRTPVAGIVHAVTLLLILLLAGRWAGAIPMATLAAILLVVAWHMSDLRTFVGELRGPRSDAAVLVTTFLLTVVIDLTVAIAVGMVLAAFLFMKRMAETTSVQEISGEFREEFWGGDEATAGERRRRVPRDVEVYEINGPFFFGAAETFLEAMSTISKRPRAIVLVMESVPVIDATGLRALTTAIGNCRKSGVPVLLVGLRAGPRETILASSLASHFSRADLEMTFDEALQALGPTGEHRKPG